MQINNGFAEYSFNGRMSWLFNLSVCEFDWAVCYSDSLEDSHSTWISIFSPCTMRHKPSQKVMYIPGPTYSRKYGNIASILILHNNVR